MLGIWRRTLAAGAETFDLLADSTRIGAPPVLQHALNCWQVAHLHTKRRMNLARLKLFAIVFERCPNPGPGRTRLQQMNLDIPGLYTAAVMLPSQWIMMNHDRDLQRLNVSHCAGRRPGPHTAVPCTNEWSIPSMYWAYQMQRHGRKMMKHVENMTHLCYPLLSFAPNDPTWSYLLIPWCHVCYCMFILFTLYCEYFSNVNMAMSSPPVPVRELQHLCDQHTSMQLPAPFYGSDLCIYALNMLNVGETLSSCHHTPSYPISALGCQILSLLCSSSSFSTVQGWPMPWNGDITWYSHLFLSDDLLTVAFSYLDLFRLQVQVVGFQGLRNCSSSGRYFAASQLNLHWTADKPWPAWQASSTFQGHPGELGRYSWVLSNAAKDVRVWHLFILFRK